MMRAQADGGRQSPRFELLWIGLLTLLGLLTRWPYWRTIPLPGDETNQATLAMHIARGAILPLTGTDAYTGPFFVYLMAGFYRLGVSDPLLGRTLQMITGVLLVPVIYALARRLTGDWRAAGVAAALIATNPHLIVLSSHHGAATTMMPFFVGLYLWWMIEALDRDRAGWWLAAVSAGGFALQANLVAVLPLAGTGLWFAWQAWHRPGLRRRWWLWMAAAISIVLALSAPVIVHNLFFRANTLTQLQDRGYLWESNPTLQTYLFNLVRLVLQVSRQTAGVMGGEEALGPLLGLPLLTILWALGGLLVLPARARWLTAAALAPYVVVPWYSAHFGILTPVRFTTYMTLLLSCGMGALAAEACRWVEHRWRPIRLAPLGLALAVALLPLQGLSGYYAYTLEHGEDGAVVEDLAHEIASVDPGVRLFIVFSDAMLAGQGVPYIWQAYATMQERAFEFVPLEQVLGRLYTEPGPALILCTPEEAARLSEFGVLDGYDPVTPVDADRLGYRLYRLDPAKLRRPDFVLTGERATTLQPGLVLNARVGGLELIGLEAPPTIARGETAALTLYWRRVEPMERDTYTLFVHLLQPDGSALVAQVDRVLGRAVYPVNAWGQAEVIVDAVDLSIPADVPPGLYPLRIGVYRYPSLERLTVPDGTDNAVDALVLDVR